MKRILYNLETNGGGGSATVPPPASTKGTIVQTRVDVAKPPPPDRLKGEFSVESFDVDQLPKHEPLKIEEKEKKDNTTTADKSDATKATVDGTKSTADASKSGTPAPTDDKKLPAPQSILKPPVVKEDKSKVQDAPKEGVTQVKVPQKAAERDLSGYTPEQQTALRQMSNEGFNLAVKLIKENKDLQNGSYLQHEQAYVLDPQYQQHVLTSQDASVQANHWLTQLTRAEKGEEIQDFHGYDKNGKPILSNPFKSTSAIVEQMRANYQNCINGQKNAQMEMQRFPEKYKSQIKNDHSLIESEIKKRFEWEEKPELLDYTMPVDMGDGQIEERSIKQIREDFTNIFPQYLRNQVGIRVAANLMVSLQLGRAMLAQQTSAAQIEKVKASENGKAEPTSEVRPVKQSSKTVHGVQEFSELKL